MTHKLKILSMYYDAILRGNKTFEVRKDDRPFNEGDALLLQETVTPNGCGYTGREMTVEVTYILRDSEYVKNGYCIMGIKIISTNKARYYNNNPSRDRYKKTEIIRQMQILAERQDRFMCSSDEQNFDFETNHKVADSLLCDMLIELGYADFVNLYKSIHKYYGRC